MAETGAEPSMEDILSSIKRIIAEEGDTAPGRNRRPTPRPLSAVPRASDDEGVLELNEEVASPRPVAPAAIAPAAIAMTAAAVPGAGPARHSAAAPPPEPAAATTDAQERIVSDSALRSTRGALESLSRLMVRPEPGSDGTLEGLVREMLKPMLSEWLDANLPALVETMVAREIAKITAQER